MKRVIIAMIAGMTLFVGLSLNVSAGRDNNPAVDKVKETLTDIAHEKGIPPEILKAMASHESNYKQFDQDGSPHIAPDGGIGIMQITPDNIDVQADKERLKTDWKYNIKIGAQVLLNKWNLSYLPDVNKHDKSVLEDWYFAIMAYNGLSKTNDPSLHPGETYQEDIYQRIEQASLLYGKEKTYFEFPEFDIRYEDHDDTMKFPPGKQYSTDEQTTSMQQYSEGDVVYIDEKEGYANSHAGSVNGEITKLWPYTPLKVKTSEPIESSNSANDFVYYKTKGIKTDGYVASAYLQPGSDDIIFSDTLDDRRAAALAFASMNGYVKGHKDGSFGSENSIKREHVAVILNKILNLKAPDDYTIQASDKDSIDIYKEELRLAEYAGLLGSGGKLRPKEPLSRAQMAQVMNDAFSSYYEEPKQTHTFEDQDKIWNPEPVNTIYYNEVTVADPFRPYEEITRSQFVLFIYRTMVDHI